MFIGATATNIAAAMQNVTHYWSPQIIWQSQRSVHQNGQA